MYAMSFSWDSSDRTTYEDSLIVITQIPLVLLTLSTGKRLSDPCQPTYQHFWNSLRSALNVLTSGFALDTSISIGQFGPPIALLCLVSSWLGSAYPLLALGFPFSILLQWPFLSLLWLYSAQLDWFTKEDMSLQHTKTVSGERGGLGAKGRNRLSSLCLIVW